jgi:hypothetical protein
MPEYKYPGYGTTTENWLTPRANTKGGYHGGGDNPAKAGTPVYAQYGGEVFRSGVISGYGMAVVVKSAAADGQPFYKVYAHLGPGPLPVPGTPIEADKPIPGAVIGTKEYVQRMGGLTSGPHLHREIISGRAPLNADPNKPFGIYSSDITYRADPDTFDINHPVFPYQNGELKPPRQPGPVAAPARPSQVRPPRSGALSTQESRSESVPPPSTGMVVPDASGPTSLGGPNGPAPLQPPMRSRAPANSAPAVDPLLPPLHFAPEQPSMVPEPFRSNAFGGPTVSSAASGAVSSTSPPLSPGEPRVSQAATSPAVWASFPLEALFARDRDVALDRWASSSRQREVSPSPQAASVGVPSLTASLAGGDSSNAERTFPGGLLGMIQEYMRSSGD